MRSRFYIFVVQLCLHLICELTFVMCCEDFELMRLVCSSGAKIILFRMHRVLISGSFQARNSCLSYFMLFCMTVARAFLCFVHV